MASNKENTTMRKICYILMAFATLSMACNAQAQKRPTKPAKVQTKKDTLAIIQKKVEAGVFVDGAPAGILGPEDVVEVSVTNRVTRIIKLSNDGFLEVLQHKLQ